jgi:hypothetical protein
LRGAIHAELIDYSLYEYFIATGGGTEKEKTLSAFIEASGASYTKKGLFSDSDKELYILIHFHALADIGTTQQKDIRKVFVKRWSLTNRQVDISRLWDVVKDRKTGGMKRHKIDDAMKGMARYCYTRSNDRLTFSRDWGAGEKIHQTGLAYDPVEGMKTYAEIMKDRNIDEDLTLSLGEVRLLVKVHNAIGGISNEGLNIYIHH